MISYQSAIVAAGQSTRIRFPVNTLTDLHAVQTACSALPSANVATTVTSAGASAGEAEAVAVAQMAVSGGGAADV